MIAKRECKAMERALVASLTDACEHAKPCLPGFIWLTHTVNYHHFPESLIVTWVFDTEAHLAAALKSDNRQYMHEMTAKALAEASAAVDDISRHIDFDSQQACQRTHGGDWQRRLGSRAVNH